MRRPHRGTPHVNLLPLLDVLLCTMGTLIVVLGVLNQRPQDPSKTSKGRLNLSAASQDEGPEPDELAIACEQFQLRVDQLTKAREKTTADLEAARQRLSHIEDHSRQISQQIDDLQLAAKQLPDDNVAANQRAALRGELLRLNTERMRLEADLNKARSEARYRRPAFAIVPYDGIHKTHRRPIYIECRADSIILQPEGIVFTAADFLGPDGPGNPLASALRAAREYWSQQPPPSPGEKNEPYPLLLVRPDGISAYGLARGALASWESEFGYELIDADWKLEYPLPPQVQLKELEQRAVADARQRLQWLAQTSPERFVRRAPVQYRLSPTGGGLVRNSGMGLGKDPFASDPLGGFGRSARNGDVGQPYGGPDGIGSGNSGRGGLSLPSEGDGIGTSTQGQSRSMALGGMEQDGAFGASDGRFRRSNGAIRGNQFGGNPGGADAGARGGVGDRFYGGAVPGDLATDRGSMTGAGSAVRDGTIGNAPMHETVGQRYAGFAEGGAGGDQVHGGISQNPSGGASNLASQSIAGAPDSPALGSPGGGAAGSSAGATAGGSAGQSSSGGQPPMSAGMPSPTLELNANQPAQRTASRSVAQMRGRNWALPTDGNASVPIARPIRLECWPDRIVVISDSREQPPQVIPLTARTEESVDQLVGAIRDHTKRWGIAGQGMYWKPQLMLQVNPNGEARAEDLQVLLANSGLEVKRK